MFRIDDIDDKNTEWNLNETRIIIPMVDGDSLAKGPDKIVRTVNLISEDEDQNTPTGSLEHSLVVGLDKNLFEPHNAKTDLLIIQDSDLKLLSCNPDLKHHLGYSISYVEQDRSETLWENPELKHKPKEWTHDSAVLEVKDILIFDEKPNEKINLNNLENESKSFLTKLGQNVEKEEIVERQKNEKNFQLFINYIPESYTISPKGKTENSEILGGDIKNNGDKITLKKSDDHDVGISSNDLINFKDEVSTNASDISELEEKNIVLPERSLPLKKKAKMKKTVICSDSQRSLLKQELVKNNLLKEKSSFGRTEEPQCSFQQGYYNSHSEETFYKINKRRKIEKTPKKPKSIISSSPNQKNKDKQAIESEKESTKTDLLRFDITKFKNMYDLVEGLRKYRMISVPVWQMLNAGMKEMNVDILKEIIEKRKEPKGKNYSPQLKAFALVLYFKQPVAFNFLAKICNGGWPSLNVIKEWKLQLNSHQRPNFVGVHRKAENKVC